MLVTAESSFVIHRKMGPKVSFTLRAVIAASFAERTANDMSAWLRTVSFSIILPTLFARLQHHTTITPSFHNESSHPLAPPFLSCLQPRSGCPPNVGWGWIIATLIWSGPRLAY